MANQFQPPAGYESIDGGTPSPVTQSAAGINPAPPYQPPKTQFQPPPGYEPVAADQSSAAPSLPSADGVLSTVGSFAKGILPGAVESMGETIQSLPYVGKKIITPEAMAAERAYFSPKNQSEAVGQAAGRAGETVLEFVLGDEALKGLSIAEKIGLAGKIADISVDSPYIGALLRHGVAAARNGTVGTVEALAHGATLPQALETGATTGIIGGVLGGAGELAQTAPSTAGKTIAKGVEVAGSAGIAATGATSMLTPKQEGETDQQATDRQVQGALQAFMGTKAFIDSAPYIKEAFQKTIDTIRGPGAKLTEPELAGKITQATGEDVPAAQRALRAVGPKELTKIETYDDLSKTLDTKVRQNTVQINALLDPDKTLYQPGQLEKSEPVAGGTPIVTNPVQDAIDQLHDYYAKTKDVKGQAAIEGLQKKFETAGLTLKEVNDIAREHGNTLNAYNAQGEIPATALTRQAAENTRQGVKEQVRERAPQIQGIDSQTSDLIKTRELARTMAEKVQTLENKIQIPGAWRRAGQALGSVADAVTGGFFKKLVGLAGTGEAPGNVAAIEDALSDHIKRLNKLLKMSPDQARQNLGVPLAGTPPAGTPGAPTFNKPVTPAAPGAAGGSAAESVVTKEYQSPLRQPYPIEITDEGGARHTETISAFSIRDAMKTAQKQFPTSYAFPGLEIPGIGSTAPLGEYSIPTLKHLSMPESAYKTPEETMLHENGHAFSALNEGIPVNGIIRHTHMDADQTTRAAASYPRDAMLGPDGRIIPGKEQAVARAVMGGIAADEEYNKIPRYSNHNFVINRIGSDANQLHGWLLESGFTHEAAVDFMHAAIDSQKKFLTNPHVSAVIRENAGFREPGLSSQFHYSPNRLNGMYAEMQRRMANDTETNLENRNRGGEQNVAGRKVGSPQAPSKQPRSAGEEALLGETP